MAAALWDRRRTGNFVALALLVACLALAAAECGSSNEAASGTEPTIENTARGV